MKTLPSIRRIVPNIYSNKMEESKHFYTSFLGMQLAMDMGWIITFVSKDNQTAQLSIFQHTKKAPLDNTALFISIEVANVDRLYKEAQERHLEIVYPLTNEAWEVRRFFIKDPNGVTLNLLTHIE